MPHPSSSPRLLVCFDGSEAATRAIQDVAELFAGASAVVLTVWKPVDRLGYAYGPLGIMGNGNLSGDDEVNESIEADARQLADEGADLARRSGLHARAEVLRASGSVELTITTRATHGDVDMIVVGTVGHSQLGGAVFGSVSNALARHASLPVLLLRPMANRHQPGGPPQVNARTSA